MAHLIYLVEIKHGSGFPLEEALRDANRCRKALQAEFPREVFDNSVLHGVLGVRLLAETSCPDAPKTKECRAFARGFMASADLWER